MLTLTHQFGDVFVEMFEGAKTFKVVVQVSGIVIIWSNGVRIPLNQFSQDVLVRNMYGFLAVNDDREVNLDSSEGNIVLLISEEKKNPLDGMAVPPIAIMILDMFAVLTRGELANIAYSIEQFYNAI